ncbi:AAA family ATPase [Proteiniclasticum sp. C24MP]|uniref:AAA family ATPase n=1 Tax=Proteiniclasticum sp. C24MP TaxID=3374101 RepID=UPI003754A9C4
MIGFFKLRERFLKAIKNDTLSHAHIIIGPDGIGKSLLVETLSREILGFGDRDSVDIVRVRPEKTIITVNQVREVVIEASLRPYEGYKKVIIFYEANKIGQEAQNALLKTIEEPMEGIYFFLLAENEMFMADTIKSRCHMHKLLPMDEMEMEAYVDQFVPSYNEKEEKRVEQEKLTSEFGGKKMKVAPAHKITLSEDEKRKVISASRGIPGKAERIILGGLKDESITVSFELLTKLAEVKRSRKRVYYPVLELGEKISQMELEVLFDDFTYAVKTVLKKKSLDEDSILLDEIKAQTEYLSRELTFNTLEKYLEIFFEMRKYISLGININKDTIVSSLLLRLMEV